MTSKPTLPMASPQGGDLEACLGAVELRLAALGEALRARDVQAIDVHASELHRALALAVDRFSQAARTAGGVPMPLRRRLAVASGQALLLDFTTPVTRHPRRATGFDLVEVFRRCPIRSAGRCAERSQGGEPGESPARGT